MYRWENGKGMKVLFVIDEYVYYASEGVCRVADICLSPLKGMPADRLYLSLIHI